MKHLIVIAILMGALSCKSQPRTIIDSTQKKIDSLIHITDSLKSEVFLSKYKLKQVQFYIDLCNKKPSQKKFFFGWVTRAVK